MTDEINTDELTAAFSQLRTTLVLDALDGCGLRRQALHCNFPVKTSDMVVVGVAKTLLWLDFAYADPETYALELEAVDSIEAGDMVICATADSRRSAIWGELLTTAAVSKGATGIVTDGAVRDVAQIRKIGFPVFATHLSPYDSFNRQKVVAVDVDVEIGGVSISPGDIVVADVDGVVVVPAKLAGEVAHRALEKGAKEQGFRDAVRDGVPLAEAYRRFGIL